MTAPKFQQHRTVGVYDARTGDLVFVALSHQGALAYIKTLGLYESRLLDIHETVTLYEPGKPSAVTIRELSALMRSLS